MRDPASFVLDDNWSGGFYELHMQLGPNDAPDADARLLRALAAVWADPQVVGCYLDRGVEPEAQVRVAPLPREPAHPGHLYGRATLPSGPTVVCGTVASRDLEVMWLAFYLPTTSLANADPRVGGFPFGDAGGASRAWQEPIDAWLVTMAHRVHATTPIHRAAIGHEAWTDCEGDVPDSRSIAHLIPTGDTLLYHPANRWV